MTGTPDDAKKQEQRPDAEERRAYWTAQLEKAYAFMDAVKDVPYEDCGEPLVSLRDAAGSGESIRWFGARCDLRCSSF